MELARHFSKLPRPKRGILFAAFTGEEIGLLGSSHLAANMPMPLGDCAAMINMDMVGRMKDDKFYVAGAATGSTFKELLQAIVSEDTSLKPDLSDNLSIGGSDHTSFSARQVPALFFFSGLHGDYHKPSDTWDKIDPQSYAKLIRVVAATAEGLANAAARAQFQKVEAPLMSSGGGGYGPYFGSVPDFAAVPDGVKFADVRSGSPAEKAGLKGGDILIEFDGKPVKNLQDYTYLLRSKKAGDRVTVKVQRGSETVSAEVVLGSRK
jgi:membrane-associated protease RseP (regulator of RpoE activity)